jgi:hypothetical protein
MPGYPGLGLFFVLRPFTAGVTNHDEFPLESDSLESRAPLALANCTAAPPELPEAPRTRRVSLAFVCARRTNATQAVWQGI